MLSITGSIRPLRYLHVQVSLFVIIVACLVLPEMTHAQVTASGGNFGTVNVGSTSPTPLSATFMFGSAATLGTKTVVTQGATGLDFTDAGTGTCTAGTAYTAGETCTVNVKFAPIAPGVRYGAAVLLDSSGNVLATGYLQGTGVGPQVGFLPGTQSTISSDNDFQPAAIAADGSGNFYLVECWTQPPYDCFVYKETLAGATYTQSEVTSLPEPMGTIAVDGAGNVYAADPGDYNLFKFTPSGDSYTENFLTDSNGDNLYAAAVAVDGSGNLYWADTSGAVSEICYATCAQTLNVSGLNAVALAVDSGGNVFVVDHTKGRLLEEKLSAEGYTQSTIASGLSQPSEVSVDGKDNVYIADTGNNRILKETLSAGSYTQSTIASGLYLPTGVAVDSSGNVYISDTGDYTDIGSQPVLKIDHADPPSLSFAPTAVGSTSTDSPQTVTLSNFGNAPLTFPVPAAGDNPSIAADFTLNSSGTSACPLITSSGSAATLGVGASCQLTVSFTPIEAGAYSDDLVLTDNALNAPAPGYATQSISLTGLTPGSQMPATLTSPTPGSTFTGSSVTFAWKAAGGATAYELRVGTSGAGSNNIFDSGPTTATSAGVSGIPISGAAVYVELLTDFSGVPAQSVNYVFIEEAPLPAVLTSPAPGSTFTGSSETFSWTPGTGINAYQLSVGTTGVGSSNIYGPGDPSDPYWLNTTSATVTGIPTTTGATVYVQLSSYPDGVPALVANYTFTEATAAPGTITSPIPGSTLTTPFVTFAWTAGVGATAYDLRIGTAGAGSNNVYDSGSTTATSAAVSVIPTYGAPVYVELISYFNGAVTKSNNYVYTEATPGLSGGNFGPVNVGSAGTSPISVTFTFGSAATLGSTKVVTQGATGLDFTDAGTGTCKSGIAYTAEDTCTVGVIFAPMFPGTRNGAAVLFDGSGNVLATGYFQGTGMGPQVNFLPGLQSTVATGIAYDPGAIAVDASGNVYVADAGNNRLLKETLSAGTYTQSTIASGIKASGVAVDGSGNVYFTDTFTGEVVKETLSAGSYAQSVIISVANMDAYLPHNIAVDGGGNIYLAEPGSGQIVKESLSGGSYTQSTVASGLNGPFAVAVDGSGNVYVVEDGGEAFKETLSAGGYVQSSLLFSYIEDIWGIAVDGAGNVYAAGSGWVERLGPSASYGIWSALGGTGSGSFAVNGNGDLYIANSVENSDDVVIEKVEYTSPPTSVSFATTYVGATDWNLEAPPQATLENIGNAPLTFPVPGSGNNPSVSANFGLSSGYYKCPVATSSGPAGTLPAGAACDLYIGFAPTVAGNLSGSLILTDNSMNAAAPAYATQTISLSGTALATAPAALTSPAPGSILTGSSVTFTWTAGADVGIYELFVGTTGVNSNNLYNSHWVTTTSATVNNIPMTGAKVYVMLRSNIEGTWQYAYYTFTESGSPPEPAVLTAPSGVTLTDSSQSFTWSTGSGVSEYELWVGTTGVTSSNLYNSGWLNTTSATVSNIPTSGGRVFVRLMSLINGTWQFTDYTFTESGGPPAAATLISPTGTTLTGSSQTFTWSPGAGVSRYALRVGTTGYSSKDIFDTGSTMATSVTVNNIPTNGGTVFVGVSSEINGVWQYAAYTFIEAGGPPVPAALTSPTGNSLSGASQTFTWTHGAGVTVYQFWVGTAGVSSSNLYDSGWTNSTTATVSNIPTSGGMVFVRLWSLVNRTWQFTDYSFVASGTAVAATLISPTGTTLTGSSQTFTWTTGTGVTRYALRVGTTGYGSKDIYDTGSTTATSATVNIPSGGGTIYVGVSSQIDGVWKYVAYTFTAP